MTEIDYEKLDNSKRWYYKVDRIKAANAAGCQYITEHAHQCYKKAGGVIPGAKMFGMCSESFRRLLHEMKAEMNKPGGNHNKGLTRDLVVRLRAEYPTGKMKREYVMEFNARHGLNMSHRALETALSGKSWGEVL